MYNLNQLKNELEKRYNHIIELDLLEKYIYIWNIEQEFFDEEDEVFDETSIHKLHRGLKLQDDGFGNDKIPEILEKTSYISENKKSVDDYVYEKVEQTISKLREEGRLKINDDQIAGEELKEAIIKKVRSREELFEKENKKTKYQTNPAKGHNIQESSAKVVKIRPAIDEIKPESDEKTELKAKKAEPKTEKAIKKPDNDKMIEKLSDKVSEKVASEILQYFQDDCFLEKIMSMGALKRDNEILSKQVAELINANSALEEKIFNTEFENKNFKKIWGKIFFYLGDEKLK